MHSFGGSKDKAGNLNTHDRLPGLEHLIKLALLRELRDDNRNFRIEKIKKILKWI